MSEIWRCRSRRSRDLDTLAPERGDGGDESGDRGDGGGVDGGDGGGDEGGGEDGGDMVCQVQA